MATRKHIILRMDDGPSDIDYPSDTGSSFQSSSMISSPKTTLMGDNLCSSSVDRSDINESILALEKSNPTTDPCYSKKLNGVWKLAISAFGSPGLIGYQVLKAIPSNTLISSSDLTITINSIAPRVEAKGDVKVVNSITVDFAVASDLIVKSGSRMTETYVTGKIGQIEIPLSSLPSSVISRDLIVTYLDDDLLIVRDSFGGSEVLKRKEFESNIPAIEGEAA